MGEGRAGRAGLCSSAPSGAGVGAGPRVPCEQHRMAGHCVLCCKRPSHGRYCCGQEVTNKDTPETVARRRVVREQQGAGCSPAGGARPGRSAAAEAQSVLPWPAPGLAGDLQNLASPNVSPLSPASRREHFPLRGRAVIAPAAPRDTRPRACAASLQHVSKPAWDGGGFPRRRGVLPALRTWGVSAV